ncbi:MAG: cobyrinate a,c-diamide synthase [Treponema sp.]|nr:cobyrinate a,c-diamide synthase [Treponema sp.]
MNIPRIVISAPSSSSGKTTVVCALLQLLENCAAVKFGPDFIDPLFHSQVLNRPVGNIDLFFTDEERARQIFVHDTKGASFAVCEGAMGYYDGLGGGIEASTYHASKALSCPVILVVDARGKSLSVCAEINGFASFREQNGDRSGIRGVILNRCSSGLYKTLSPMIEKECGIPAVGYLEENGVFAIKSRHLGLVTPDAVEDVQKKVELLADAFKKSVDVEKIRQIALSSAPFYTSGMFDLMSDCIQKDTTACIAYARDEAFCFYYRENLDLLASLGAKLIPFSPLHDSEVPEEASALYIGGGYPELFPLELSENTSMMASVRAFCRRGLPVVAECGGFMYLQLVGILPGTFHNTGKLVRFGYCTIKANEDTLLCKKGDVIRAHEFHYFDTTDNGSSCTASKANGKSWPCIKNTVPVPAMPASPCSAGQKRLPSVFAGFPHLYFPGNPDFARAFVERAALAAKQNAFRGGDGSRCQGCRGNGCADRRGSGCSGCSAGSDGPACCDGASGGGNCSQCAGCANCSRKGV